MRKDWVEYLEMQIITPEWDDDDGYLACMLGEIRSTGKFVSGNFYASMLLKHEHVRPSYSKPQPESATPAKANAKAADWVNTTLAPKSLNGRLSEGYLKNLVEYYTRRKEAVPEEIWHQLRYYAQGTDTNSA